MELVYEGIDFAFRLLTLPGLPLEGKIRLATFFCLLYNLILNFSMQDRFVDLFWDVNQVLSAVAICRFDGEITSFK